MSLQADQCWLDVQPALREVSAQLQHGEMLHSDHFSLFEAMSAVQIGDPKMDAGLDAANAPTAQALVEQGLAPLSLTPPQLIATMDQLTTMQASWHAGNTLAQTVFVCLYMLKPCRYLAEEAMLLGGNQLQIPVNIHASSFQIE